VAGLLGRGSTIILTKRRSSPSSRVSFESFILKMSATGWERCAYQQIFFGGLNLDMMFEFWTAGKGVAEEWTVLYSLLDLFLFSLPML